MKCSSILHECLTNLNNSGTIIALKASGRDCTNNNELLHKKGVVQRYVMQLFVFTSELLQGIRWSSYSRGARAQKCQK